MTSAIAARERASVVKRVALPGARLDRLFFAQVREDPRVELSALRPGPGERVVVVSSGGCTALSLLATGAEVHAVDINATQNHLVELKAAAVARLPESLSVGFLGGSKMAGARRLARYRELRTGLSIGARAYWDARRARVAAGIINAGESERFIRLVSWLLRHVVHDPERVRRMLACGTLAEQRALFDSEWNTRRWRWLFAALLNRWSMSRAYDPAFFARVRRRDFADLFLALANHALTEIQIEDNYFLRHMLTGEYATEHPEGVPPYLSPSGMRAIQAGIGDLRLVDGGMTEYLRSLPPRSVDAFALSNICEWLDARDVEALFREVERTAAADARVVFRNFVGWTELPAGCSRLTEVPGLGEWLIRSDRSAVQSRAVVCRVFGP